MRRKWIYLTCLLAFLGLPQATVTSAADSSLVGWWKLDETSGIVAHDSSGYGNDGILFGDPQWGGGGLEFDGDGDYVDCGDDPILNIAGSVTITGWIRLDGPGDDRKIAGNQDGITGGYKLGVYGDQVEFEIRTADSAAVLNRNVGGGTILEQGAYHHVAGVYSQGDSIRTYVNGVLDRELLTAGVLGTSRGTFKLGREPFSDSYFWLGLMDDVRVYNRALSQGEIQALAAPTLKAHNPNPPDGATDVSTPLLTWEPGEGAICHNVYFGTSPDLTEADLVSACLPVCIYWHPVGLEPGVTYYWRIDEVYADGTVIRGDVWSFTVANYLVVDDFENYTDDEPNRMLDTWIDGWDDPTNGATVGHPDPDIDAGAHIVETTIVHSGAQSMPYFYDNSSGYSEARRTLSSPRDWTEEGVRTLSLWFHGDPNNSPEPMYVAVANRTGTRGVVYNDNPDAAQIDTWTQWCIEAQAFADQGVNLADVDGIAIGFGDRYHPTLGGSGTIYFDDIQCYSVYLNQVGVEWVVDYKAVGKSDLVCRKDCAEGFYNAILQHPDWAGKFNVGNAKAWEKHFKQQAKGGTDSQWVDAVDFVYFAGHGAGAGSIAGSTQVGTGGGFTFGVNANDDWVLASLPWLRDPQWGDGKLNWIVLDVCSALPVKYFGDPTPSTLAQRWANSEVMHGLHYIFGFRTEAHDSCQRGKIFADFIMGKGVSKKYPVRIAWRYATMNTEWEDIYGACLYAASPGKNPENEHIPGHGPVSDDPDWTKQFYYYCCWPCSF
jgi:hypothetical protein